MTGTPTFVLCIENNAIRDQALLLCESIRRFGGRHRDAPIVAVAPRPGLGIDRKTLKQLDKMSVEYAAEPLNGACPEYGSANRVFTAAWAEQRARTEWLVILDSDTVFLDELELPADADAAVRPVDTKGSTTTGPGDPFEEYWDRLAALQGIPLSRLPFVQTTDGAHRVRASYNGGLIVVRRERGILSAWADLFARSIEANLKPYRATGLNVFASTGYVGREASEYWGSNQRAPRVDWVSGCAWLLRADAVREIGPLDEEFFMYFEDVDYCRRLWAAGWQVLATADAELTHATGRGSRATATLAAEGAPAPLRYFSKHLAGLDARRAARWLVRGWRLRALAHTVRGWLGHERSARDAARYRLALARVGSR